MKVFKPFLWSYDTTKMDLVKDQKRIITNVLNWGTHEASRLLFKIYDPKSIKQVVLHPSPGDWNKKSLNYWSLMFKVTPRVHSRRISKK